jgi:hypothetical protein
MIMSGGIISKNSATAWRGGGIYIESNANFSKRSNPGNSSSGIIYGSVGSNANVATDRGNGGGDAVYRENASPYSRNATLGPSDEISTQSNTGWGR